MSKLQISRDSGFADKRRNYKIICNSELLGTVGNGETITLDIKPGDYEVFLKVDWCRSNKINIHVNEGEKIVFNGGSNLRGWKLILGIPCIFLFPHKYLWLHSENS